MTQLAYFIKTFSDDFPLLKRLLDSFLYFNITNYPICITAPSSSRLVLNELVIPFTERLEIHTFVDEELAPISVPDGWLFQQYVKLNCFNCGVAESYIMLDSDFMFMTTDETIFANEAVKSGSIPITISNIPCTVTYLISRQESEGRLKSDKISFNAFAWIDCPDFSKLFHILSQDKTISGNPDEKSKLIPRCFGWDGTKPFPYSFQPMPTLNSTILKQFSDAVTDLPEFQLSLLKLSPWEYNWYGLFAIWQLRHSDNLNLVQPRCVYATDDASLNHFSAIRTSLISDGYTTISFAQRHLRNQPSFSELLLL